MCIAHQNDSKSNDDNYKILKLMSTGTSQWTMTTIYNGLKYSIKWVDDGCSGGDEGKRQQLIGWVRRQNSATWHHWRMNNNFEKVAFRRIRFCSFHSFFCISGIVFLANIFVAVKNCEEKKTNVCRFHLFFSFSKNSMILYEVIVHGDGKLSSDDTRTSHNFMIYYYIASSGLAVWFFFSFFRCDIIKFHVRTWDATNYYFITNDDNAFESGRSNYQLLYTTLYTWLYLYLLARFR